jgi:xanthine dehydrogenase YagR molybdenum-binding subunit
VTGHARYPSDEPIPNPAWAFLVTSAIARGRIRRFDLGEALAMPGMHDILTHENVGGEAKPPKMMRRSGTSATARPPSSIGEIGIVGMKRHRRERVFHATGRRIRRLPNRFEGLL